MSVHPEPSSQGAMSARSSSSIPESLKARVNALPHACGVYIMKDADGTVIYVGKAKDLASRVKSYFSGGDTRASIEHLLARITQLETIATENERQALILEAELVRRYQPRYNIRLKDDKAYLLVRIDRSNAWPRLELVRRREEDEAEYIGPFAFSYHLHTLLDTIKRSIPLRSCADSVFKNRVRPCLEYQIKRCLGPCCYEIDRRQYLNLVDQAAALLRGENKQVIDQLQSQMEVASDQLRFEDAAQLRDRILSLRQFFEHSEEILPGGIDTQDAFGLSLMKEQCSLSIVSARNGRLVGGKNFSFSSINTSAREVLSSAISQFYASAKDIPSEILLPFEPDDLQLLDDVLSQKRGKKVRILLPQQGAKLKLLRLAVSSAEENLGVDRRDESRGAKACEALAEQLGLDQTPRVIECADISHIQGSATVASIVCFIDGQPAKDRYRCFHLSQEGKPDDFSSMKEVVGRHLSRGVEENSLPDLLVIDGGPQQLEFALRARTETSGSLPPMIALAKKRKIEAVDRVSGRAKVIIKPERIYREGSSIPDILLPGSEALMLLERLRDEAHRFAITFHRRTRLKKAFKSKLDNIPGIGPKRRQLLLRTFGSIKAIKESDAHEIATRCSLPRALADNLLRALHEKSEPK